MNTAPTLGRIKDVIKQKGYGDLFKVKTLETSNNVSGEIPLDFLYALTNTPGAIEAVNRAFEKMGYKPTPVADIPFNTLVIKEIQNTLYEEGLVSADQAEQNEVVERRIDDLSKLLFIGIRSKDFGGWFDDWFIITDRSGSLYHAFPAHTDLDYGKVHSSPKFPDGTPIVIKPGYYPNLFHIATNEDLTRTIDQYDPIDLYALENVDGKIEYKQALRGNFQLTVGCQEQASDDLITRQMYAVELKKHSDCEVIDKVIEEYLGSSFLSEETMFKDGKELYKITDNLTLFPYLLLEETDFQIEDK